MVNFITIDVETANPDFSSICQIGIAKYSDGELVDAWCQLINPEDYFDFYNTCVHSITENDVKDSPKFHDVIPTLREYMDNSVCVSHTSFDRVSILRACSKYKIEPINAMWLDSARVVRRTWQQFARRGYGLRNICSYLNYEFKHHNALEDAKASGYVILAAIKETGIGIDGWFTRVNQPIDCNKLSKNNAIRRDGNPEGEFYGEVLCFTGALEIPRKEAAELAASIGCEVASDVTKKTTILVVGDQDIRKLAGKSKSSKHQKAENLISKGQEIRIIGESDFIKLIEQIPNNAYFIQA